MWDGFSRAVPWARVRRRSALLVLFVLGARLALGRAAVVLAASLHDIGFKIESGKMASGHSCGIEAIDERLTVEIYVETTAVSYTYSEPSPWNMASTRLCNISTRCSWSCLSASLVFAESTMKDRICSAPWHRPIANVDRGPWLVMLISLCKAQSYKHCPSQKYFIMSATGVFFCVSRLGR